MRKNKIIVFIIFSLAIFFVFIYLSYWQLQKKSKASKPQFISFNTDKAFIKRKIVSKKLKQFSFYTPSKVNQTLTNFSESQADLGLAALTDSNLNGLINSSNIDQFKFKQKIVKKGKHFFYQQEINNLPVFGSYLTMHYNENSQLYGFDGKIIEDQSITIQKISEEEAQNIALDFAIKENSRQDLEVFFSEKNILNKKLLGIDEDETNYLVLVVWIKNKPETPVFLVRYFVSLFDGQILFKENLIHSELERIIYSCRQNGNCLKTRSEGEPAVGDSDVDNTYETLGKIYNFFKQKFNLDSFDNKGSVLKANVHYPYYCPNAFFDMQTQALYICNGMATNDIIAHEVGHGVTGSRLVYSNQSGAMNESMSDIYAYGVDPDWELGEGSVLGVVRRMDNPPAFNQPDRLFSSKYYCGNQDEGGVHVNSGILNKTFYLMSHGGNFNDCQIEPIGQDKAWQIFYRAVTVYIPPSANFRNMYEAVLNACYDLYGHGSADCNNARRAMEATEMDQQNVNSQKSPVCFGASPKTPACVGAAPTDSLSPTSGVSPLPTLPISTTPSETNPTSSVSTTPPVSPTLPSGNTNISLKIKFQGIEKKPENPDFLLVKVSLVDEKGNKQMGVFPFFSDENGIWSGKTVFNLNEAKKNYFFLIKGPKHLQKRICDDNPKEKEKGYYNCQESKISLSPGNYNFDFSKIVLLAGDLPIQDGIVNSVDLSQIRQYLGLSAINNLTGDVNYDGVVNTQDYSIVLYALSLKFDD